MIQQRADLWRGRIPRPLEEKGVPTGFVELDRELAGGGWPRGALTEILSPHQGREALRLMVPALIRLSREARWIAWVAPPYLPYAPGLAGRGVELSRLLMITPGDEQMCLWGLEQALRSGACSAALAWPEQMEMAALRRLQLAAEAGNALAFLFRPEQAAHRASPAALRLRVRCLADGMAVDVLKRQGGWAVGPLRLQESRRLSENGDRPVCCSGNCSCVALTSYVPVGRLQNRHFRHPWRS